LLKRVINASGVILHTNLGRAPLPEAAIDQLRQVSTATRTWNSMSSMGNAENVDVHIERILQQLLDAKPRLS